MSLSSLYEGTSSSERGEGRFQQVRSLRVTASSFPVGNPCARCVPNPEADSSPSIPVLVRPSQDIVWMSLDVVAWSVGPQNAGYAWRSWKLERPETWYLSW